MNVTPEDAQLLYALIMMKRPRLCVEIGTNTGYAAIHMGLALRTFGGKLITIERDPELASTAKRHIIACGLAGVVEIKVGDAPACICDIAGPFDFAFLDAKKDEYCSYIQALIDKLSHDATVVADNTVSAQNQMRDYMYEISDDSRWISVTVVSSTEKDDGMTISQRVSSPAA